MLDLTISSHSIFLWRWSELPVSYPGLGFLNPGLASYRVPFGVMPEAWLSGLQLLWLEYLSQW